MASSYAFSNSPRPAYDAERLDNRMWLTQKKGEKKKGNRKRSIIRVVNMVNS